MTTTQFLLDAAADRRLQRDGFVLVPFVSPTRAAELRRRFLEPVPTGEGFHSDLVLDDPVRRRQVRDELDAELGGDVRALFRDHEVFLYNYLCKWPGPDSELYLHRDWMYVDERLGARTHVVWLALQDITGANGQLQVLRGSHRFDDALRGPGLEPPWLGDERSIRPRLLSVPVPAGHAVVFDNALVHCSFPNLTDEPRVAVAVGVRPRSAPLVHFRRRDAQHAERYDVDESFFLEYTPQGLAVEAPSLPVAEVVPAPTSSRTGRELARAVDASPLGRLDQAHRVVHTVRIWPGRVADSISSGAATVRHSARDRRRSVADRAEQTRARVRDATGRTRTRLRAVVHTARNRVHQVPSMAAMAVLGTNEAVIDRLGPRTPAVWDHDAFEWSHRVEAAYPAVRAEVDRLLAGPTEIPHIEDVTGGIPQGNEGPWRSFVLMHQGRWIDWNCERCPATTELVRTIPGLMMAGFSVLEPGTHITEHRGPNKGALRYQLGVVVPGEDGDCRIRVGDEMLVWREGEGVMFDFTVPHEAWNDSSGIRVLLMLEVLTPLPWYLRPTNRVAQRAMGWFPTTRDMKRRLAQLEPTLVKLPA